MRWVLRSASPIRKLVPYQYVQAGALGVHGLVVLQRELAQSRAVGTVPKATEASSLGDPRRCPRQRGSGKVRYVANRIPPNLKAMRKVFPAAVAHML